MKLCLNGRWQGRCVAADGSTEFSFSGTVPGCVHTDLAGTKLPADLYWRDNTDACQWVEDRAWEYSTTFTCDATEGALVFEGLDTYAHIYLNGQKLASTENMFICHRIDTKGALRRGENTLTVHFDSPIHRVAGQPQRKAAFSNYERLYTRRVQCTYGWDWVARYVTCGIWRDVYLQTDEGFTPQNAYIYTAHVVGNTAQLVAEVDFTGYARGAQVEISILDPEGKPVYIEQRFCQEPSMRLHIDLPNAQLWYPAGYGQQPLYTLLVNGKAFPFGIRTLTVLQLPDEVGSPYWEKCMEIKNSPSGEKYDHNTRFSGFRVLVNDVPVMCKGANWVPGEPFPSAESHSKITRTLSLAREAGVNMLRVWGGGIFEADHFYSECDRLGILVTQDFLMACGQYPEEQEWFLQQLQQEAAFAALTLRNHPCLAWWSGDNENAVQGSDKLSDYRGRTAIYRGIAPVLTKLDPQRRFLPSSPYGGDLYASKTVGTTHNTQYLGCEIFPYIMQTDMADYKEFFATLLARFIAEEPTCGAISLPSLKKFMTEEDIFQSDEMWQYHTKSNPALSFTLFDMLQSFASKVLGEFADGHDRFFKLKYNQYEWIRVSMENIRRNRGFCDGIVYWMWNDCWPAATGWSFVDYYCLPKASFYSFKRCAGALLASIDRKNGLRIHLCNDSLQPQVVFFTVSALWGGRVTEVYTGSCTVPTGTSTVAVTLPEDILPSGGMLICDAVSGALRDRATYRAGKLPIVPCEIEVVRRTEKTVTLRAPGYVHAVELEGKCIFEDNYFTMLPFEERTVSYRPAEGAVSDALTVTAYTVKTEEESL